jgi:hypothetical protein
MARLAFGEFIRLKPSRSVRQQADARLFLKIESRSVVKDPVPETR